MDEHDLECLLITGNNSIWERGWANIRWVTNYMGTMELDCTCVFPREGDPMLAILGLNGRLPDRIARSIVTDVRGLLNTSGVIVDRINELGLGKGRIGIITPAPYIDISHDHHQALVEAFPNAEFPRFSDEFWMKRIVMSAEELACIDEAGRIGDAAVSAIMERLKPGMREVDLFNIIYDVFSRRGRRDPVHGARGIREHVPPGQRVPAAAADRSDDREGRRACCWSSARATGTATRRRRASRSRSARRRPTTKTMLDVCFEAYHAIVDVLKPGCTAKDIRRAGQVIQDRGYTVVAPLVHGVFNPLDAGPFVGTSHRPDKDVTLAPGMGLCVEIHPCSEDVIKGVFLGDTYVITEDGARSVNKLAPKVYQL